MAKEIRSAAEIKKQNVESIKRVILEMGSVTKPEVAEKTGLSVVTCGSILNELTVSGFITEENLRLSSGGRPAMSYRFTQGIGNHLCIYTYTESNGTYIRYQVQSISGDILGAGVFQEKIISVDVLAERISSICNPELNIKIVVLGIQGSKHNNVVEFSDLPDLIGHNLAQELEEKTGISTKVESDMNTVALGYTKISKLCDKDDECAKNVAMLFFPRGQAPAGSFIVDGRILQGATNQAGELSFFTFDHKDEDFRSIFSNLDSARPAIAKLLVTTIAILDPAVIVITGGLSNDMSYDRAMKLLRDNIRRSQLPKIEIRSMVEKEYFAGLHSIAVDHLIG